MNKELNNKVLACGNCLSNDIEYIDSFTNEDLQEEKVYYCSFCCQYVQKVEYDSYQEYREDLGSF